MEKGPEQYQPSEEEIKKAEEMMTEEQKKMSKEREIAYSAGRVAAEQSEKEKRLQEGKQELEKLWWELDDKDPKKSFILMVLRPSELKDYVSGGWYETFRKGMDPISYMRQRRKEIGSFPETANEYIDKILNEFEEQRKKLDEELKNKK
jgi:hypothetical protein